MATRIITYHQLTGLNHAINQASGDTHHPKDPLFNLTTTPTQQPEEPVTLTVSPHPTGLATVIRATVESTGRILAVWRIMGAGNPDFRDGTSVLKAAQNYLKTC